MLKNVVLEIKNLYVWVLNTQKKMKSALPFTLKGLQTLSFFIYFDENVIQFLDIKNKEVTC